MVKRAYPKLSCFKNGEFIKNKEEFSTFIFLSTKKVKNGSVSHGKKQKENASGSNTKRQKQEGEITPKHKFILLLSGAFIGFLNGFFGGGGGMVCVPILEKVLSLDSKHSHATAIAVIFPLSLISACIYVANGYIKTMPLLTVGLGVVAGGILGAFSLKFLPPKVVQIMFALIMFAGGIKLIL